MGELPFAELLFAVAQGMRYAESSVDNILHYSLASAYKNLWGGQNTRMTGLPL
jgi:hypothetical protein